MVAGKEKVSESRKYDRAALQLGFVENTGSSHQLNVKS